MRIKIVDDDQNFIEILLNRLKEALPHVLIEGSTSFNDDYESDLYFLDIDMPLINGIDLARKIKKEKEEAIIIFVSYRDDLIFEALQTFPYYFLRKKYLDEELPMIIEKIKKELIKEQIQILYKGKEVILDTSQIMYIEKNGQYTHIHTTQHLYIVKHTIKYYEDKLSLEKFGYVSQSFIAHFKYVKEENSQGVIMKDGHQSYYSRGRRKKFIENYLKYITL